MSQIYTQGWHVIVHIPTQMLGRASSAKPSTVSKMSKCGLFLEICGLKDFSI